MPKRKTKRAVEMLEEIRRIREQKTIASEWLAANAQLTDANAAIFDAANDFAGCIPGVNEVLRRQARDGRLAQDHAAGREKVGEPHATRSGQGSAG